LFAQSKAQLDLLPINSKMQSEKATTENVIDIYIAKTLTILKNKSTAKDRLRLYSEKFSI
jgi:hypothetical protein